MNSIEEVPYLHTNQIVVCRFSAITPILFVLSFSVNAQSSDFSRGYLITGTDTLRGFIAAGKDPWNLSELRFKERKHRKKVKTYTADSVTAFFTAELDELYVRHTVFIERTPMQMKTLEKVPTPRMVSNTVFLKKLVV